MIGSGTPTSALPSATATYGGRAAVRFFPPDRREGHELFLSDLALTAEFSGNTVSGVMDNWESLNDAEADYSGPAYTVNSAPITGNGFAATIAPAARKPPRSPLGSSALNGKRVPGSGAFPPKGRSALGLKSIDRGQRITPGERAAGGRGLR